MTTYTFPIMLCPTRNVVLDPLFAKIDVNGDNAHPLFAFLKDQAPGIVGSKAIKWNFTKLLVDRKGKVVKRFSPQDTPESLREEIEQFL